MAAVIGEFVPGLSRFHTMISSPSLQHQQQPQQQQQQQHSRESDLYHAAGRPRNPSSASSASSTPRVERTESAANHNKAPRPSPAAGQGQTHVSAVGGGGASQLFPSPPHSSSPTASVNDPADADDHGKRMSMATQSRDPVPIGHAAPRSDPTIADPSPHTRQQQPSPPSDDFPLAAASPSASYLTSEPAPSATAPKVIHVRDLAHVQSLAASELLSGNGSGVLNDTPLQQMKYEISAMPISDIIEMVAALLTKITTTNDLQHDAMSRNVTHQQQANQSGDSSGSSQMSPLSHSVLAFHGKNVPAITILSYLSRIHKYCPTTYEVFLSLLVYFDRMTERVNELVTKSEEARRQAVSNPSSRPSSSQQQPQRQARPQQQQQQQQPDAAMADSNDSAATSDESDSDLADDSDDDMAESPDEPSRPESARIIDVPDEQPTVNGPSTYFVVDSFNIHRLIIAGITCASKFFSDVFYTNSRYAKVGGLPLAELNHLEIQFLVLNEFRLAVPVEDLEAYATMLVEFYAREVVAQKTGTGSKE